MMVTLLPGFIRHKMHVKMFQRAKEIIKPKSN
jgi:hypothetical protein